MEKVFDNSGKLYTKMCWYEITLMRESFSNLFQNVIHIFLELPNFCMLLRQRTAQKANISSVQYTFQYKTKECKKSMYNYFEISCEFLYILAGEHLFMLEV